MSTAATQTVPELTIFSRVASIPLVNESLSTVHSTLENNAYTCSPYSLAQNLGKSAYSYSEPIQMRLAPILVRADGFANMGLDVVERRYPAPFKVTSEEILHDLKQKSDNVIAPAYSVAHAIDQRMTPIVDCVEVAVNKLHTRNGEGSPKVSPVPDQSQYQRAVALSKDFREQLYWYSNDQFKQIEKQSILVQRATSTAHSISDLASSSYVTAQTKVHALSDTMIQELQKIQTSTATLPSQVQSSLKDVSEGISASIHDITAVLKSDLPLSDKVGKVGSTVQERVQPLLEAATNRVQEMLKTISSRGKEATEHGVNGQTNDKSSNE